MKEFEHAGMLRDIWSELYGNDQDELLGNFLKELESFNRSQRMKPLPEEWYRDVVVYSLYVDLFNEDFKGLGSKLDYLSDLGVSCLWLLPILDSPMRDAGFDIRDYRKVRPDLLPEGDDGSAFNDFVRKAHERGIRVIFDIAINHTSEEHYWFREARKGKVNPYRDYYIWSEDASEYRDARIIFKGIEDSNWARAGDAYFFHRFFDFQPDLNYRNPKVLIEMCRNFLFWLERGVDGFRADAIPYLWKEEGTDCENLPETHLLVKFFRAVLDMVRPNTLLLAEACQKPHEVVKYFGNGDECHAGYHFPLMPQMFKAIASGKNSPVRKTLSTEVTPAIPEGSQWFTFLRCHDELSLELVYVSEEDRKYIHDNYCKQDLWDFREGQGISARLSELMDRNPQKIGLAYSIMLSLPGTPVIYYGDEFGKLNDEAYYREQIGKVGKDDTRFLVRGRIDWDELERELHDKNTLSSAVYTRVKALVNARNQHPAFGKGSLEWVDVLNDKGEKADNVLAYIRAFEDERILCIQNLSQEEIHCVIEEKNIPDGYADMLGNEYSRQEGRMVLGALAYHWIRI